MNAHLGADCVQKHYLAACCGKPIPLYQTLIKDTLEIKQKKSAGGRGTSLSSTMENRRWMDGWTDRTIDR